MLTFSAQMRGGLNAAGGREKVDIKQYIQYSRVSRSRTQSQIKTISQPEKIFKLENTTSPLVGRISCHGREYTKRTDAAGNLLLARIHTIHISWILSTHISP
jgi:hypothetical protein